MKTEKFLVDNHAGWRLGLTRFSKEPAAGRDSAGAKLAGADSGARTAGPDSAGAKLAGADSGARTAGPDSAGAKLAGADSAGAEPSGPDFAGAKPVGRPAIIIPGYGMNSFIFRFHPSGPSMVECLVARGLEVWTVDLRGQGRSIRAKGNHRYGLADLAVEDLGAAIAHVLRHTRTGADHVDLVGCSLGTALAFGHVACLPKAPVHAIVALAGLVTWRDAHPLVRVAYGSPKLAGLVRFTNTRRLARFALPVLTRLVPSLLSVYLNEKSTDLSQISRLVQTVEDPHPGINREIAEWIQRGDLVLRGINVSQKLPSLTNPFLCVIANQDGIVLPVTARHTFERIGSTHKELILVGDEERPVAHADLFLCKGAQERVFAPTADFLLAA